MEYLEENLEEWLGAELEVGAACSLDCSQQLPMLPSLEYYRNLEGQLTYLPCPPCAGLWR